MRYGFSYRQKPSNPRPPKTKLPPGWRYVIVLFCALLIIFTTIAVLFVNAAQHDIEAAREDGLVKGRAEIAQTLSTMIAAQHAAGTRLGARVAHCERQLAEWNTPMMERTLLSADHELVFTTENVFEIDPDAGTVTRDKTGEVYRMPFNESR